MFIKEFKCKCRKSRGGCDSKKTIIIHNPFLKEWMEWPVTNQKLFLNQLSRLDSLSTTSI